MERLKVLSICNSESCVVPEPDARFRVGSFCTGI